MKNLIRTGFLGIAAAFFACTTLTGATAAPVTMTVRANQADTFVDSIGVNVHLGDVGSAYNDFPKLQAALQELGVRHLRDGLVDSTSASYYADHNALGALGIKSIFSANIGQTPQLWQSFPSLMNQSFEGYENPNEIDDGQGPNWLSELLAELPALSDAVRGNPNSFPVYGPALVYSPSFSEVGDVARYFDYGNLHNYPGGRNPETPGWGGRDAEGNLYGSIGWQLDLLHIDSPGLPWVTTETGYTNEPTLASHVPQSVAAIYMPRLVLHNWASGAARTYIYELISDLGVGYGLIEPTWVRKPDFYALANLLTLLADPGPAFQTKSLTYSITGADIDLNQMLFQKRDGTFYLALWRGVSCYNTKTDQTVPITSDFLDLQFSAGMQVTRYLWSASGRITTTVATSVTPYKVGINDKLTILKIAPAN